MSAPMDDITCPFCSTEGWPTVRMFAAFAAHCGTAWSDDGYSSQSESCRIISGLRLDIALNNLLKETA